MTTQVPNKFEYFAQEIQNKINDWKEEFDSNSEDHKLTKFNLELINDEIEKLLVQYSLCLGCDDTVFEVPISLCLDSPIGIVKYNGETFGASQNIRTWIRHLSGAEFSEHVSTTISDKKLIELVTYYWSSCLSKMSEFE